MSYTESSLPPLEEARQGARASRRRFASLIVLCAALFLEAMNLSSINVQLPAIRQSLHLSTATAQFVVSVYLVTYAGFLLLGGRIADQLDRRLVFMGGVALFGLASLAGGLALEPTLLVVARAVQGIGAAFTAPAALSIITTTFDQGPERNKALGIYSGMGASGFAVGGALGLALVTAVYTAFTPKIAGAHPMVEVINQALVSGFRPALWLAAIIAFLGMLIALVGIKGHTSR